MRAEEATCRTRRAGAQGTGHPAFARWERASPLRRSGNDPPSTGPAQGPAFSVMGDVSRFASGAFLTTYFPMETIHELQRLASPAPKPQSLAWDGSTLWMGSRETKRLYALNPAQWTVGWTCAAPDVPWGLAAVQGELRVICSDGPEDLRVIRRCLPGHGFDGKFSLPCPEGMGSHLGWDGRNLWVSQWYPQKLIALGADGQVERVIQLPFAIVGQVILDGMFYLVTTEAEETDDYFLTRVDPRLETPQVDVLIRLGFSARGLAFDGKNFWSNHREANQIVSFARPD